MLSLYNQYAYFVLVATLAQLATQFLTSTYATKVTGLLNPVIGSCCVAELDRTTPKSVQSGLSASGIPVIQSEAPVEQSSPIVGASISISAVQTKLVFTDATFSYLLKKSRLTSVGKFGKPERTSRVRTMRAGSMGLSPPRRLYTTGPWILPVICWYSFPS